MPRHSLRGQRLFGGGRLGALSPRGLATRSRDGSMGQTSWPRLESSLRRTLHGSTIGSQAVSSGLYDHRLLRTPSDACAPGQPPRSCRPRAPSRLCLQWRLPGRADRRPAAVQRRPAWEAQAEQHDIAIARCMVERGQWSTTGRGRQQHACMTVGVRRRRTPWTSPSSSSARGRRSTSLTTTRAPSACTITFMPFCAPPHRAQLTPPRMNGYVARRSITRRDCCWSTRE